MSSPEPSEGGKSPPRLGSYQILQPLGSGGMSSVFHAIHVESGHEIALKVLPRTLAKNPTLLQRFLREAKNAEALEHPNIASIYDRGFDQGRHYLVLEYVEGGDLHDRVKNQGPLGVTQAVQAIRAVAEGLNYALGRGVIHRDVKPANLLLTPAGKVKIIDLGLALQTEAEDERVTRDGTTVGTVDYMAPEQARDSRETSERSDIYSLGCTFYFLLTGSPPFPGGDVVDKLGRHCTAPIPDVRELRPEASEELSRLIKKMMAKRPENRFPSYEALIVAIDALPELRGESAGALDALIVDDDDDDDDLTAGWVDLTPKEKTPSAASSASRRSPVAKPAPSRPVAEVSLAELAELDHDTPAPARSAVRSSPGIQAPLTAVIVDDDDDDDEPDDYGATSARLGSSDVPLKTWIGAGAVLGLAIGLLGYGALQLFNPSGPGIEIAASSPEDERPNEPAPEGVVEEAPRFDPIVRPVAPSTSRVGKSTTKAGSPPPAPAWVEPTDSVVAAVAEPSFPEAVESQTLPDWARRPVATTVEGPSVSLRRINDPSDPDDLTTLRQAFDRTGGIVEIADNGPFFEDDLRMNGKTRLVRARLGFRPMIRIESSTIPGVRERPSVFALDGAELILKGVDLVVDVRDLSPTKTTVFQLKGAKLTLVDSTVTILNGSTRPFSLVRIEEPGDERPNRMSHVRLERSLIRGSSGAMFDLATTADIAVSRSILLQGNGAVVVHRLTTARGERKAAFLRSIVASRGALAEVPGGRSFALQLRSLGSTFAKVAGLDSSALLRARADLTDTPGLAIEWNGTGNTYLGWPSFFTTGEKAKVVVGGLPAVRQTWRDSDAASQESKRFWASSVIDDEPTFDAFKSLPDAPMAIVSRATFPSAGLIAATSGTFERQPVPVASHSTTATSIRPAFPATPKAIRPVAKPANPATSHDLTFSLTDATYRGDLGLFLQKKVSPGQSKVRVRVSGGGNWAMTPVRLPDGVSLDIESASARGSGPTWQPLPGSNASALIAVSGGDLSLRGINLITNQAARVQRLVAVEDGHLLVDGCSLRSSDLGSGLILFRASGTRPITPPRAGPFLSPSDRPSMLAQDSILRTVGGEGVGIELGRGVVSVSNCVLVGEAGADLFGLRPRKVASHRFEVDLDLDHCTVLADGDVVRVADWPGTEPGPARPWLVSTHRTAFIDLTRRGKHEAVLLRTSPGGVPHSAMTWQAIGDAYDFIHFATIGDSPPAPTRSRPDVKSRWIDLWGPRHIVNVLGPSPRRTDSGLTFLARDRPKPAALTIESLKLDPMVHPDLGAVLDRLAGLALNLP